MTGYAGSRDYVGTSQSPQKTPHRFTHPTEKQDSDPLVASSVHSGMCGSVWGLQQRLRGPYVIPGPGVPRHINMKKMNITNSTQNL